MTKLGQVFPKRRLAPTVQSTDHESLVRSNESLVRSNEVAIAIYSLPKYRTRTGANMQEEMKGNT